MPSKCDHAAEPRPEQHEGAARRADILVYIKAEGVGCSHPGVLQQKNRRAIYYKVWFQYLLAWVKEKSSCLNQQWPQAAI